ncbi:hypothetical protein CF15_02210 [Pyrodictium occultum]|uniref:TFIIB-type domain-containing protein n=1 Tax=Pyrodictium occultum TaxID=2309 RepID=A0A0V8RUP2_PYROC|nr:TFIIB-type zinc ribbon-containing protein [Pyrodictium occultum]KSW11658.1 hypothetical protein CF15_02210 [Pyrodictium occultum]
MSSREYQNYYTASTTRRCPHCGSEQLVLDPQQGILVCRSCGAVIDDTVFDATPHNAAPIQGGEPARLTQTERSRVRLTVLQVSITRRLSRMLDTIDIGDLLDYANTNTVEIIELYKTPCIKKLLKSLHKPEERKAALEAAVALRKGDYPLASMLASQYRVGRRKMKLIIRRVMECLGIARAMEALATA